MTNKKFAKFKKVLQKYEIRPSNEDVFEIMRNVKSLASAIVEFERKKGQPRNTGPPKKRK